MERQDYPGLDEKAGLLPKSVKYEVVGSRKAERRHSKIGVTFAVLLFLWWSIYAIPSILMIGNPDDADNAEDAAELGFDEIIPSEKLEWHPCYRNIGVFKCARLTVAMDYNRPLTASEDNPKVHIALLLKPGIHLGSQKFSTSPLLLNPGGPGGSGVTFALGSGTALQNIVGLDQDIIGFDPRGIGATTPKADCFSFPRDGDQSDEDDYVKGDYHRMLWRQSGHEIGVINSSSVALQKIDIRARAITQLCEQKDLLYGIDSIFRHLSTPSVARDMLSIVTAWDEWIESLEYEDENTEAVQSEASDGAYSLDTKGKLVYWGFSYGTLLGATYASMFPDRVGRIVLDGVVDADHYVDPVWTGSLRDTDAVWSSFFKYCHSAKNACALYRLNDKISDIEDRYDSVISSIQERSISFIDPSSKMPVVVSYSDIKMLLFGTLYSPTGTYHIVAMIIDLLYRDLPQILSQIFAGPYELQPFCGPPGPAQYYQDEAQNAIMCSDKRYMLNETIPNLETLYERLANASSWADIWMSLMVGCDSWKIKAIDPPMRWDSNPAHKQKPINTSYPLLFIGNTADPVTPLYAAVKMAGKFVDAGLIEQKSEGHCSLAAVSLCTIGKISAYFKDGKVPPPPVKATGEWVQCEANEWPFHRFDPGTVEGGEFEIEEMETLRSAKELQQKFYFEAKFWGQVGRAPNLGRLAEYWAY